jgi:hypothetical protein
MNIGRSKVQKQHIFEIAALIDDSLDKIGVEFLPSLEEFLDQCRLLVLKQSVVLLVDLGEVVLALQIVASVLH